MVKLVADSLKKTKSFPRLPPSQKPSIVESYISPSLSQFLEFLFDGFLSRLLHWFSCGSKGCHRSLLCPINCESVVINTMADVSSLFFTVSGRMDHEFTHDFWQKHWPQTSTHRHMPQTSAWSQAAVQTTHINIVSALATDIITALGNTGQEHQQGLSLQLRP